MLGAVESTKGILRKHNEANLPDRKSTRLNSSHLVISYAVFCLKKKIKADPPRKESAHRGAQESHVAALMHHCSVVGEGVDVRTPSHSRPVRPAASELPSNQEV